jgi:zinc protease
MSPTMRLLARLLLALTLIAALAGASPASATPPAPAGRAGQPSPAAQAFAAPTVEEQAHAPLTAELPLDPLVRKGRLANGLTYLVRQNRRPEKRAELWLVVDAGSVLEDPGQEGLAHFVEHMAFNGTRRFPRQELVSYFESVGMQLGPDLNATTTFDETIYSLTVPTDRPQVVEQALGIFADWIGGGIRFDPAEVEKERGVVVEEWRLGRGADARLLERQFPLLFRGSRYAERLPIGSREVLERASAAALSRFYRDWYRPELAAVIAVGDFDPAAIEAAIGRHLSAVRAPRRPRRRPAIAIPPHPETLIAIATDPEATSTQVSVYYKHPRRPEATYGDYRRFLVETAYDSLVGARLAELAQEAEPPFMWAAAASDSLVRGGSVYYQVAEVAEGGVQQGLQALLTEAEKIDRFGFTASELERVKKDLARSYEQIERERETSDSRSFAAEYRRHFLEGEPVPGIALEAELARRFIAGITLEEVNRLGREWITEDNRVVLVAGPAKTAASLPGEAELLAAFAAVRESPLSPYVDRVKDEPLVAERPAPGPVVDERTVPEIGVTEWRLANGVRVVLKPTDFKQDEVLLGGFSPGGHSLVADEAYNSANFATALLGEGGLGHFSLVELEKALAGKRAEVSPYIGELSEGISGWASPEDLETLFQLLYLAFTAPRADPDAARSLLGKVEAILANRLASPEAAFQDRLAEALSGHHPRRRTLTPEILATIDLATALAVYRERFADASDFTFLLVGRFEPAAVKPLVETYLGGLPARGRSESFRDLGIEPPEGIEEVRVERGLEPKSLVSLIFTNEAQWSRENLHAISTLADVLSLRLREVLREDRGATYGVSVSGNISARPRQVSSFSLSFGCAPENTAALVAGVFAELAAIRRDGVAAADLAKVTEAQLRRRETQLRENGFWLGALTTFYDLGLDPRLILAFPDLVAATTAESLRGAARRYLPEDRYVLGILSPERPAAAGDPAQPPPAAAGGAGW